MAAPMSLRLVLQVLKSRLCDIFCGSERDLYCCRYIIVAGIFQRFHVLPLSLTLHSTVCADVYKSNSLFRYDAVTIVPLSATSKDLGVGLDLQITNPVTFRSPEGALFLKNYNVQDYFKLKQIEMCYPVLQKAGEGDLLL